MIIRLSSLQQNAGETEDNRYDRLDDLRRTLVGVGGGKEGGAVPNGVVETLEDGGDCCGWHWRRARPRASLAPVLLANSTLRRDHHEDRASSLVWTVACRNGGSVASHSKNTSPGSNLPPDDEFTLTCPLQTSREV